MNIMEINNVSHKYKNNYLALNNVNFTIKPGEILSILGPNGAGKTTLIKIIAGFIHPTLGSITIKPNTRLGIVFGGDLGFYNNLSAEDNLKFFGRLKKIPNSKLNYQITTVLKQVNLSDAKLQKVSTFSKGMKQRLHIARALLDNPQFLLLDEPTNGLDIEIADQIRKLIKSLNTEGYTIILTSHIVADIENLSNRIIMLNQGTIEYDCSINKLLALTNETTFEHAYLKIIADLKVKS